MSKAIIERYAPGKTADQTPEPSPEALNELLEFTDRVAWWLDDCLRVPGTRFRFGLDALFGLIPVGGDALSVAVSALTLAKAKRAGVPTAMLLEMSRNVVIDFAGGLVPGLGDVFDAVFRSHRRNFELLRKTYAPGMNPLRRKRHTPVWVRIAGSLMIAGVGYGLWQYFSA